MTVLTDLALGICNARWGAALFRQGCAQRQYSQILWGVGFLAAAMAAILGGISHAVGDQSPPTRRKLWKGTTLATGLTSASMFASTALACTTRPLKGKLLMGILAKLLAYCAWMTSHDRFLYVIIDYASAMAGIIAFHGPEARRSGASHSRFILGGVFVSIAAALVQIRKVTLHRHFNHNDLYHLIQIGACYLFYRGGRLLQDQREQSEKQTSGSAGDR
ncbi:MAG: hypothetical protein OXM03_00920 [Chloroflexota bacterium]|nr:hypothetical protein [Chloroflexota bacterium]MDE2839169.1 hypothetical protein [Chloroflexota bacterium]MDE2930044.1 hypothetical protein [Chloroflexota bacterium]